MAQPRDPRERRRDRPEIPVDPKKKRDEPEIPERPKKKPEVREIPRRKPEIERPPGEPGIDEPEIEAPTRRRV
jgi:hypothetical protein